MHARRSHRPLLRRVALTAALAALLAPAGPADAEAAKKKKVKQPVVTKVRPMKANIGDTITVHGKYFKKGKAKNTVLFKRQGARAVFVKADVSTPRQIRVVLSPRLADYLINVDGKPGFTRFQVRILARRLGKSYTPVSKSPMVGPEIPKPAAGTPGAPGTPGESPAEDKDGDCDGDGTKNSADADDDNDLLDDDREKELKLDACKRDTDEDGAEDGFELRSARDLNDDGAETYLPYPYKLPYPNPLFADSNMDYDGDGLTLLDEYKLWVGYGTRNLEALNYSDGKQFTLNVAAQAYDKQQSFLAAAAADGISQSTLLDMDGYDHPLDSGLDAEWAGITGITDAERFYYDLDKDGLLADDERDEDADGLSNWVESHGYGDPGWWNSVYAMEKPFTTPYAGTKVDDADTDGDGVVDGADDQDHDGFANVRELGRQLAAGEEADGTPWVLGDAAGPEFLRGFDNPKADPASDMPRRGWVQPFNPCLPDANSRTCPRYVPYTYPPFNPETKVYFVLN